MYVLDAIKTASATEGETSRGEVSTLDQRFTIGSSTNNGKGATRNMAEYTLQRYVNHLTRMKTFQEMTTLRLQH